MEQPEQLNERRTGRSDSITGCNGRFRLYIHDEPVKIGTLLHTGSLYLIAHLKHGGINGINRDTADLIVFLLIHLSGHVSAATLHCELNLKFAVFSKGCNVKVRVCNHYACRRRNICRCRFALAAFAEIHNDWFVVFRGEYQFFNIQKNFSNVFFDTRQSCKLMECPGKTD